MRRFLEAVIGPALFSIGLAGVATCGFILGQLHERVDRPCGPTVTFPDLPHQVHERPVGLPDIFDNAVRVSTDRGHGTGLYCRGLDPKGDVEKVLVITSAHVVEGADRVLLTHEAGRIVTHREGRVVYRAMDPDVALIEPLGEDPFLFNLVVRLLDGEPTIGEPVWFVGLIDGENLALETTIVSSTKQYIGDQRFYGITGVTYPGSSGSCVFVQRDGKLRLIGLVTCGRRGTVAPTWINTNGQIAAWLAGLK